MSHTFHTRLTRTFGFVIVVLLAIIGAGAAMASYASEVRALAALCRTAIARADSIVAATPASAKHPLVAIDRLERVLNEPRLVVVIYKGAMRYEGRSVSMSAGASPDYVATSSSTTEFRRAFFSRSFVDRAARYVAVIAGYNGTQKRYGGLDVKIVADTRALAGVAFKTLGAFAVYLLIISGLAYLTGRYMAREALRPLDAVSGALEAWASGELTPRPLVPVQSDELGRLALAYNHAITMVDRAFAERSRAEVRIHAFIADASHQLRTPLAVLRGFVGILRKDNALDAAQRERIVTTMDRQITIMTGLVEKLVLLENWEHDSSLAPKEVEMGTFVRQIVEPIAQAHPDRHIALSAATDARVMCDPDEISHAITNLVTNALKYAPDGEVSVTVGTSAQSVEIAVADSGPGLSEVERRHAFDRFYRGARRDVPGSGLGLAIAKRAVERAGGSLAVASPPGEGARFSIQLPRAPSASKLGTVCPF